jgi:hypothetical protein
VPETAIQLSSSPALSFISTLLATTYL